MADVPHTKNGQLHSQSPYRTSIGTRLLLAATNIHPNFQTPPTVNVKLDSSQAPLLATAPSSSPKGITNSIFNRWMAPYTLAASPLCPVLDVGHRDKQNTTKSYIPTRSVHNPVLCPTFEHVDRHDASHKVRRHIQCSSSGEDAKVSRSAAVDALPTTWKNAFLLDKRSSRQQDCADKHVARHSASGVTGSPIIPARSPRKSSTRGVQGSTASPQQVRRSKRSKAARIMAASQGVPRGPMRATLVNQTKPVADTQHVCSDLNRRGVVAHGTDMGGCRHYRKLPRNGQRAMYELYLRDDHLFSSASSSGSSASRYYSGESDDRHAIVCPVGNMTWTANNTPKTAHMSHSHTITSGVAAPGAAADVWSRPHSTFMIGSAATGRFTSRNSNDGTTKQRSVGEVYNPRKQSEYLIDNNSHKTVHLVSCYPVVPSSTDMSSGRSTAEPLQSTVATTLGLNFLERNIGQSLPESMIYEAPVQLVNASTVDQLNVGDINKNVIYGSAAIKAWRGAEIVSTSSSASNLQTAPASNSSIVSACPLPPLDNNTPPLRHQQPPSDTSLERSSSYGVQQPNIVDRQLPFAEAVVQYRHAHDYTSTAADADVDVPLAVEGSGTSVPPFYSRHAEQSIGADVDPTPQHYSGIVTAANAGDVYSSTSAMVTTSRSSSSSGECGTQCLSSCLIPVAKASADALCDMVSSAISYKPKGPTANVHLGPLTDAPCTDRDEQESATDTIRLEFFSLAGYRFPSWRDSVSGAKIDQRVETGPAVVQVLNGVDNRAPPPSALNCTGGDSATRRAAYHEWSRTADKSDDNRDSSMTRGLLGRRRSGTECSTAASATNTDYTSLAYRVSLEAQQQTEPDEVIESLQILTFW